jgi:hypothetical protein
MPGRVAPQGDARRVTWADGSDFARRHGCLYVECSAKANIAVATAFEELVLQVGLKGVRAGEGCRVGGI